MKSAHIPPLCHHCSLPLHFTTNKARRKRDPSSRKGAIRKLGDRGRKGKAPTEIAAPFIATRREDEAREELISCCGLGSREERRGGSGKKRERNEERVLHIGMRPIHWQQQRMRPAENRAGRRFNQRSPVAPESASLSPSFSLPFSSAGPVGDCFSFLAYLLLTGKVEAKRLESKRMIDGNKRRVHISSRGIYSPGSLTLCVVIRGIQQRYLTCGESLVSLDLCNLCASVVHQFLSSAKQLCR